MARALRIQYPHAIYHVMARGNRGGIIFSEPKDREIFFRTLTQAVERAGFLIHAYVLLETHYHLLLETPAANLVDGMKWLQQTFTQRLNAYHRTWGHVYQGRYKSIVVDDENGEYFRTVGEYIHLNPVEAGLVNCREPGLEQYPYSSHVFYLQPPRKRPGWLVTASLMAAIGIQADNAKGRRDYRCYMRERTAWAIANKAKLKSHPQWKPLRRGWCHGTDQFRQRMLKLLAAQSSAVVEKQDSIGLQKRDYCEAAAEAGLSKALEFYALAPSVVKQLAKSDERKMLLAGWLKRHFSVTNDWISAQLWMGHRSTVTRAMNLYNNPPQHRKREVAQLRQILPLSS